MSASSASTYILRRKWTVIDNCDNKAVAVQYLSVRDTVPPAIACPANIAVNADGAICGAVVPYSAPVTSDNCSTTLVVTSTAASGSTFPIGTTTVILNAKDDSGNTSTCSFRVMVADTTHPVLHNCPPNLTFTSPDSDCNAVGSWNTPSVTDHCDQYAIAALPSIASGSTFPTGFTTVMYSATDSTGNKTTCSFVVTVNETIAPELHNCPTDITVTTDTCTAKASWTPPTATDNCKLDTMTVNIASGSVFPEGPSTVVYKAIDAWGNTTTCSFKVTVKDLIHPTFSGCPKDTVVNSNGACTAPVSWAQPVATDNCGPNPLVFSIPASGSVFPVGYKYVHVYAQDGSGNQDTCVFKVTVIGPPLGFTNIPDNQQHIGCSAVVTWLPPVPTGVCGPVTITATNNPGDNFEIGVTVVTYTVTDTLGNSATASFKITVTESVPPVFNCPDSPPVEVNNAAVVVNDPDHFVMKTDTISSCDGAKLNFNLPQATDNCGTPTVTQIAGLSSGSVFKTGMHTLQFLAKDKAGNTSLCSVIIKVTTMKPLDPKISDAIGCPGTEITISTPVIPGAHYFWTGPIPGGYTDDNNLIIPKLNDNLTGIYTVRAQLNGCYTPLDSALVRIGKVPKAVDDPGFEIEPDATLDSIDVLQNDTYFTDDYDVTLETTNLPGLTDLGQGHFRYKAPARNGRVSFIYRLCSHACPDLCSTGIATITIREVICKYIPNVITPNGDGINDWLEIPCVETGLYPQNRLIIYNQWGDKVYEAAPYSNSPDAAWKGTMNGQDGKGLPDATYFYIFKPTPESQGLKGFVEIIR
jgi:gliding motility-associated-like protein